MTREQAVTIANRIESSGIRDNYGALIRARVWERASDGKCRVYVKTDSKSQRELGVITDAGYQGKSGKAVRKAAGLTKGEGI